MLGWEPSLQFEEGIEKTVRWYLENEAWMDNITSGEYEKYYESMYGKRWTVIKQASNRGNPSNPNNKHSVISKTCELRVNS